MLTVKMVIGKRALILLCHDNLEIEVEIWHQARNT